MTSEARFLRPLGWRAWPDMRPELDGLTCFWQDDLDGLQIAAAPSEPPHAAHLWGWSDTALARLRIGDDQVVGAVLTRHSVDGAEAVLVSVQPSSTWPADHGAVAAASIGSIPGRWRLEHLLHPAAITFVAAERWRA